MNPTNSTFKLTNQELELRLKDFVSKEKFLLHIILDHIKEVARRKLYLERAYPTLYEYLVKELKYSSSAAMRRQQAAQLLAEIPTLGQKIQNGSINLTQIGELSKAIKKKESLLYSQTQNKKLSKLTSDQKLDLITSVENKSTTETQQIVSSVLDLPIQLHDSTKTRKDSSVRLEITLTKEQYSQLLKARDKVSNQMIQQNQNFSWGSVLSHLASSFVEKDFDRKNKLQKNEIASKSNRSSRPMKLAILFSPENISTRTPTTAKKSVTPKLRNQILDRDRCCQYRDPLTKQICGSTFALHVDHKVPKWSQKLHPRRNLNTSGNLQILCAYHNRYKYSREASLH